MLIEKLAIQQVQLHDHFNYQMLYNDNRGVAFKDDFKHLLKCSIHDELITFEKFILAKNVDEQLLAFKKHEGNEKYCYIG